jgi:hypothetical protein
LLDEETCPLGTDHDKNHPLPNFAKGVIIVTTPQKQATCETKNKQPVKPNQLE